jgi:hypothetical protein
MPLIEPYEGEEEEHFMERCMSDDLMRREFPDNDQRYKICQNQWNKRNEGGNDD